MTEKARRATQKVNLLKDAFDKIAEKNCPVCGQPVTFSDLIRPGQPIAVQLRMSKRKEWVHVRHHGVKELLKESIG